jgi:hypothetical protein
MYRNFVIISMLIRLDSKLSKQEFCCECNIFIVKIGRPVLALNFLPDLAQEPHQIEISFRIYARMQEILDPSFSVMLSSNYSLQCLVQLLLNTQIMLIEFVTFQYAKHSFAANLT